ncbi:iron(III) transport system permease protein [Dongia mobilis]|uniref:Iron(III) transport system permease protein n=1 Tax=Dongia mobilis TaxID=578943 RepID=A0A4R6WI19_9PROT|nr:putative 2-aminoethylphosphonate ABC transporter permease subunit [Dongia mobilis]TDQ77528.1 iron(III) transport system permease protein [Dongia mobilis]
MSDATLAPAVALTGKVDPAGGQPPRIRPRASGEDWVMRGAIALLAAYFVVTLVLPLYTLLIKSAEDKDGNFIGLANFARYFADPALTQSIVNTVTVSLIGTVITIFLAFLYAYALTRTCMALRGLLRAVALVPLLAPSLLPGLALIYLFGNQGIFKGLLMGHDIYGPIGIIIGEVFFAFPHALIILVTALSVADQRLYEAADSLRASPFRIFMTVTLPGCRYGLISAGMVVFTLIFTDFGVPKVIGGSYNVLATDVYRQVIGQFNFQMGAVVGLLLLFPAVISFTVDRIVQRKQVALLSARAVPFQPQPRPVIDRTFLIISSVIAALLLLILGMAFVGSIITFWPYNLAPTLKWYDFTRLGTDGWGPYFNSLRMAAMVAIIGTAIVFTGAYLTEKSRGAKGLRASLHLLAMVPLAVPGIVLGLAYIFFFNASGNPLGFIYNTMVILVVNTICHFYTVCHLTAVTALKQVDAEFEAVSASLKVPLYRTFWRVTVPVCLPAILDISIYLFVNAMTTVSAVIFIYSANSKLMSINAINTEDAGNTASACAMGMVIVATSAVLKGLHSLLVRRMQRRTQAWRRR